MTRLAVATTNAGKVAELKPVLEGFGFSVVGLDAFGRLPTAPEDEATLAGNARSKARFYARLTGGAALADDSGLAIDALDGAPGVRSARYAGADADDAANNALVLEQLADAGDRRARFQCALCLIVADEVLCEVRGEVRGHLLRAPRGSGGFGYDPLFVPDEEGPAGRTFAEMTRDEKRRISHRGRALAALGEWCEEHGDLLQRAALAPHSPPTDIENEAR